MATVAIRLRNQPWINRGSLIFSFSRKLSCKTESDSKNGSEVFSLLEMECLFEV
jgi:hypothetical protein